MQKQMKTLRKLKKSEKLSDSRYIQKLYFYQYCVHSTQYFFAQMGNIKHKNLSLFYSIIPLEHSIGIEPLIYSGDLTDPAIQVGCLVEIPYGKTLEHGIISTIHTECPIDMGSESYLRIKSIDKIITNKMILSPYQIKMICSISSRYMIPIHRVAAIFLSKPIRSRLEKKNYIQLTGE